MKKKKDKQNKKNNKPLKVQLICALLVLSLICCILTYNYISNEFYEATNSEDIAIEDADKILFIVEKDDYTTPAIAEKLKEQGLIDNVFLFKFLSKIDGFDGTYKRGSHYLKKGMDMGDIMKVLSSDTVSVGVTFPEGFTMKKIGARLEANGLCTSQEFIDAAIKLSKDKKFTDQYTCLKGYAELTDLGVRDIPFEGYLFPDTYYFDISAEPEEMIEIMLNNFEDKYLPDYYIKAEKLGFTTDEIIKLASIVERECRVKAERRKVAGVFYNRLVKTSDPTLKTLQSCATLQYIFERDEGAIHEIITIEDEKVQDNYNTYLNDGLPPGPICNPGIESIKAILNLEETDYYFFVLDSKSTTGSHLFAKTYSEHLKNKNQT